MDKTENRKWKSLRLLFIFFFRSLPLFFPVDSAAFPAASEAFPAASEALPAASEALPAASKALLVALRPSQLQWFYCIANLQSR